MPAFVQCWPDAGALVRANERDVESCIKSLGFAKRRAKLLMKMATKYVAGFKDVIDLPGVGEYAASAHAVFYEGKVPSTPPKDNALSAYVKWFLNNFGSRE